MTKPSFAERRLRAIGLADQLEANAGAAVWPLRLPARLEAAKSVDVVARAAQVATGAFESMVRGQKRLFDYHRGFTDSTVGESFGGLNSPLAGVIATLNGSLNPGRFAIEVNRLLSTLSSAFSATQAGLPSMGAAIGQNDVLAPVFGFLAGQGLVTNRADPLGRFTAVEGVTMADLLAALSQITINIGGTTVTDM